VVVRGLVKTAAGPVAGARVGFASTPLPEPEIAALTDSQGRFTLSTRHQGPYTIYVNTDEASAQHQFDAVGAGDHDVTIEL